MESIKYIRHNKKITFNISPKFYKKVVYYKNGSNTLFITTVKICGEVVIKDVVFDKFKNNLYIDDLKLEFKT